MSSRILTEGVSTSTIKASRLATATEAYAVRLASSPVGIQAAQALRFNVFNLELNEGLAESYATGFDVDAFDAVCDHLLVEHVATGTIVGTYRLQTGTMAAANLGYYSAQEFYFSPFEPLRNEVLELGRACVDRLHRNLIVLGLLWKGIAQYAHSQGCRYLIGCSSLTSVDPRWGRACMPIYAEGIWWSRRCARIRCRAASAHCVNSMRTAPRCLSYCAPISAWERRFAAHRR
jgi:putative hemolysin